MSIAELIAEAKEVYRAAGLDCGKGLLPPARKAAIDKIEKELGLPVPSELREVYAVHGGQRYLGAGVSGLFGSHRLLTPKQVIEKHQMYAEHCLLDPLPEYPPPEGDSGYWVPQLLLFASWDAYDLCIDTVSGEVWDFIPNSGLLSHVPNIATVLREMIAAVRAGQDPVLPMRFDLK
jgi:hypothetical protein